jgi:hypothetical protein
MSVPLCRLPPPNGQKIRILFIATNTWSSSGQLLSALITIGFQLAVVCPAGSPIEEIKNLIARYNYRPWQSLRSIKTAIADWSPSLLVCNDDIAIRELHNIHYQACIDSHSPENSALVELIELSLGDPRSFTMSRSKSRLMSVAEALQIPYPPTIIVNSYQDIDQQLGRLVYPALLKLDELWGGRGIRLVHNHHELLQAVVELSFHHDWPKSLRQLAARGIQYLPDSWRPAIPRNLSIQRYIGGRPANRAVVCWQGKILAGISIEALEIDSEFGPTRLARIIDNTELAKAAERIVANQKLSGFLGFDFMLDDANRAWLLEMNPRATPACHLRSRAPSLPASLFLKLTGQLPDNDVREVPQDAIALFPNRVSKKQRLLPYFDDLPEGETAFVDAYRRSVLLRKVAAKVRSLLPHTSTRKRLTSFLPIGTNDN